MYNIAKARYSHHTSNLNEKNSDSTTLHNIMPHSTMIRVFSILRNYLILKINSYLVIFIFIHLFIY